MDFTSSRDTCALWEEMILPFWRHRNRCIGQRFLGSLIIDQENSQRMLNIVGANLRAHLDRGNRMTYLSLTRKFETRKNWIKILTAAFSEYAYYYSTSKQGFWQGFCNQELIGIPYDPRTEIAFREIIREGIELLGLVKARQGHTFVSTLWLQSGIPQRNLAQFAELVQGIASEYGWWELAHTDEKLLSQELLEFCQEKYGLWNILINFLKVSCSDTDDVEPISGQLVQGIAAVALELERNNQEPDILKDENQRENILRNYDLPKHFFLRDWGDLVQVLKKTKRQGRYSGKTIKPRKKSLSLTLDIFGSGNIQLALPQQNLREPNWSRLLGCYCHISVSSHTIWEGNIPRSNSEFLEVPEQIIDIKSAEKQWSLRLLAHDKSELVTWHQEGITDTLPCLIFDANIGTNISLDAANPVISKTNEIICFIPKDIKLKLNNEIDILSSYVPCSISGWYGQHIQLLSHNSEIALIQSESRQNSPILIAWQISDSQQAVLRGLMIKGKKEVYLEAPTLWHPPASQNLSFNISVENLTIQEITARTSIEILASDRWQSISLQQMISTSGKYLVRFWDENLRYSYQFELKSQHLISEVSNLNTLQVFKGNRDIIESLPIQCDRLEQFWAETITIQGLWTLEKVTLTLSNGKGQISYVIYADKSGTVMISLATLHGKLSDSDWYALNFQRSGMETQRLVELVSSQPISCTWDSQAIYLSGLQSNQNYSLICWNLLTPHQEPKRIRLQNLEQDTITFPLSLNAGIYHIQIQGRSLQDLGCWCSSDQNDLPSLANEDEDLANYCYTILGNESTQSFIAASQKLPINCQRIKSMLSSLQVNPYIFPNWLNPISLQEKLEAFLKSSSPPELISEPTPPPPLPTPIVENWYLIHVAPYRRETFHTLLKSRLSSNEFTVLILEIGVPQDSVYRDLMLVRSPSFKNVRNILSQIAGFQKIEPKPITTDQVNRMLGRK
ncbi:chromosome segregation ATPases-like protein (plasmid) [Pseudanabaena sp. ABRG5-3]|nr:chromosome segregation ATPases-like protein [Pseudanabaena sp. ABRG5-3]